MQPDPLDLETIDFIDWSGKEYFQRYYQKHSPDYVKWAVEVDASFRGVKGEMPSIPERIQNIVLRVATFLTRDFDDLVKEDGAKTKEDFDAARATFAHLVAAEVVEIKLCPELWAARKK